MTTPLNTSSLLQTAAGFGSATLTAGFTFSAGRHAVVQLTHYQAQDTPLDSLEVGGTSATRVARVSCGGNTWAEIWVANNLAGGSDVVFNYGGSSTHNYLSAVVTEWDADDTITLLSGSVNTESGTSATTSSATTATSVSGHTLTFATLCVDAPGTSDANMVAPAGWTTTLEEQNHSATVAGLGAFLYSESSGPKTAEFTHDSYPWAIAVASFAVGATVDLTADGSTQAATASGGAVQQTHLLTGSGATQGGTTTAGAVVLPTVLLADDSVQGATSTGGRAEQEHLLGALGSVQSNTATANSLVAPVTLLGSDSVQENTSTDGAIQFPAVLSAPGASQPATSSSDPITQTQVLQAFGSAQPATSTGGPVGLTHQLQGAGSSQAATSTAESISSATGLQGPGSAQPATSSSGAVGQTHVLQAAGAAQPGLSTSNPVTHVLPPTGESGVVGKVKPVWKVERATPTFHLELRPAMGGGEPWIVTRRVPRMRVTLLPLIAGVGLTVPLEYWDDEMLWDDTRMWAET